MKSGATPVPSAMALVVLGYLCLQGSLYPWTAAAQASKPTEEKKQVNQTTSVVNENPAPKEVAADNRKLPRLELRFGRGSARLRSEDLPSSLRDWLQALRDCPDSQLLVEGHADAVGSRASNLHLSWLRARRVARLFERAGVPRAQLSVRAFGHYAPKSGLDRSDEAQRRVEVRIDGCGEGSR